MARAKEAKQKKLLIFLLIPFLGLAVWQGPKMYNQLFSSAAPPPTPVETAPTDPTAAPPPTASPEAGEEDQVAGAFPGDELPAGGVAKLIAFSRFTGRSPFPLQSDREGTSDGGTGGSGGSGGGSGGSGGGSGGGGDNQGLSTATFEVNGATEIVSIGEEFPSVDPTFTLVSLTEESATIGVVQGMFQNGSATMEIALGERVILVAAPQTTQYTIELLDVS